MREPEYWTRSYARSVSAGEHSWLPGPDPEQIFVDLVGEELRATDRLLDIGCGSGATINFLAGGVEGAWGVDFSEELVSIASEHAARNARFNVAEARALPFPDGVFDRVISQRGPVGEDEEAAREMSRVLRPGGRFVAIAIGERDKQDIKRIFERGQLLASLEAGRTEVERHLRLLGQLGFVEARVQEYDSAEYFDTLDDLVARLERAPIIPDFDPVEDRRSLELVGQQLRHWTGWLETNSHRLVIRATKATRLGV